MARTSTQFPGQLSLFAAPAAPQTYKTVVRDPLTPQQPSTRGSQHNTGIALCVLGSGSSGNASLLKVNDQAILIDAGLGPRVTATRMADTGVDLTQVRAVCLTHLDSDHFNPAWVATLVRHQIKVFVHPRHIDGLYKRDPAWALHRAGLLQEMDTQGFEPITGVTTKPIRLPHDRTGTVGFVFDTGQTRLGYATDLGHVPDALINAFTGTDLIAIECNYDPQMQHDSPRPPHLKRRITGGWGHLSNEQSFDAIRRILDGGSHANIQVVLLHRSQQCNRPDLVRSVFDQEPRLKGRVTLSEPRVRTKWLQVGTPD